MPRNSTQVLFQRRNWFQNKNNRIASSIMSYANGGILSKFPKSCRDKIKLRSCTWSNYIGRIIGQTQITNIKYSEISNEHQNSGCCRRDLRIALSPCVLNAQATR